MVYKFLLVSDEVDNFVREIHIDSDATFLALHDIILEAVGYTKDQMTSFFLCDEDWEKRTEITLVEMDNSPEYDSWTMADTQLSELIEEEKQKLLFVFDYLTERAFFMELREMEPGATIDQPTCTRSQGDAPLQHENFDDAAIVAATTNTNNFYTDDLYDEEGFDPNELDADGFSDFSESDAEFNF